MYSEQELTNVVEVVLAQALEDGALDDEIAQGISDYIEDHPIDPTAITGLDIAPKDVSASGNITAPSIIQTMSPLYRFVISSLTGATYEGVYVGVCQNGNKLTFVVALNITRTATVTGSTSIGTFEVPKAVHDALYPTMIGLYNALSFKKTIAISSVDSDIVDITYKVIKGGAGSTVGDVGFDLEGDSINQLPLNEKCYVRIEETFLLSNNLLS